MVARKNRNESAQDARPRPWWKDAVAGNCERLHRQEATIRSTLVKIVKQRRHLPTDRVTVLIGVVRAVRRSLEMLPDGRKLVHSAARPQAKILKLSAHVRYQLDKLAKIVETMPNDHGPTEKWVERFMTSNLRFMGELQFRLAELRSLWAELDVLRADLGIGYKPCPVCRTLNPTGTLRDCKPCGRRTKAASRSKLRGREYKPSLN